MKKLIVITVMASFIVACSSEGGVDISSGEGSGTGGSLARFAIANNFLFAVDGSELKTFSLENADNPVYLSSVSLNTTVETIFPYSDSIIFIGSTTGMFIYDISAAPNIKLLSVYEHAVACDPVVANETHAYVTLRSEADNNFCWRSINQLDVVDISDLEYPKLVNEFPMINPRGLGLYNDTLLVCDEGVKSFDISDPLNIGFLSADESFENALDIIPLGDLMIVVGTDGLKQYRFKNGELNYLSEL